MRYARFFVLLALLSLSGGAAADPILVTGNPARVDFLAEVLEQRGLTARPPRDLYPGDSWRPPGGQVINVDWTPPTAAVAALSDHPEKVERRGMLFSGGLTPLRNIRFQYYHLGLLDGSAPCLEFFVTNHGVDPARLHLVRAAGLPSLDYFSTGHGNNVAWLQAEKANQGEFLDLAPGQTRVIFRQDLPKNYVVSGTLGLTQVYGPPLQFGLLASPHPGATPSLVNLLKETDVHSRGFYPVATQHLRRRHVAGQNRETKMAVGALRQETFSGVRELRGDYGVVYDLLLELDNPTAQTRRVDLIFNPRGGAATGTFLAQDAILEVPLTHAMQERTVKSWRLPPETHRTVRLQTIPEGASSYPVRLLLRDSWEEN